VYRTNLIDSDADPDPERRLWPPTRQLRRRETAISPLTCRAPPLVWKMYCARWPATSGRGWSVKRRQACPRWL